MKSGLLASLVFAITLSVHAQNIDSLEALVAQNTKKDTIYLEQLQTLGDYYLNRDPEKANVFFRTGYLCSQQMNNVSWETEFVRFLGVNKRRLNDYDSAKYYMLLSLEKAQISGNQIKIGLSYSSLGNLYRGLSKFDTAVYYYLEGARVFEAAKFPKGLGTVYNGLGSIYTMTNELEAATKYLKMAAKTMEGISEYGIAVTYNNIGNIFFKQDQYDSALHYYISSKELKEKLNLSNGLDDAYLNIGLVYTNIKQYPLAQEYLSKSLEMRKKLNNKEKLIQTYNNLAELNIITGAYAKAQGYLDNSKSLTSEIGNLEELKHILKYQLRLDSLTHDYKSALRNALMLSTVRDSLYGIEKSKQIAELQTQYETEKKDNEIATLSQQAQIQALEISQRNIQLIGAGVILILLVIGGLLFYQQRQYRHQQAVSNMEQRLLRLQMNPHFIFNALAAIQSYIIQSNTKESISYLAKFGRLMRQILELSREEFISISEEADMLRNYLEIQQLRYQNRFDFRIDVDDAIDAESTSIPPMFAQPFVENAIEHGLKDKLTDGMIIVRFRAEGSNIRLEVEDNGSGLVTKASRDTEHKSLATIIGKERLKSLSKRFKNSYELSVQNAGQSGTIAQVLLPKISQ